MLLGVFVLALVGLSNARNLSLVLLNNAPSEVFSPRREAITHAHLFFSQGAVCLDGSAPWYYIGKGTESGGNKWILHQGGGGGATASRTVWSGARRGSARPATGTVPWPSAAFSQTTKASMESFTTGTSSI